MAIEFILNGENLPYKAVLQDIADMLNVKRPSIKVSPFIREVAWRVVWLASKITGKTPFINKQTARSSARSFFYKNEKSLSVGSFSYTPIKQTIAETGEQFLQAARENYRPEILPF